MKTNGTRIAGAEQREHGDPVEVAHPEDRAQPFGHDVDPRVEGEHGIAATLARERRHRDQHHDEQQHIDDAGIGDEVEADDTLDETDRDARGEGDLEGDESCDQRGGERPQQ